MVIVSACRQVAGHETEGQVQRGRGDRATIFSAVNQKYIKIFFFWSTG